MLRFVGDRICELSNRDGDGDSGADGGNSEDQKGFSAILQAGEASLYEFHRFGWMNFLAH